MTTGKAREFYYVDLRSFYQQISGPEKWSEINYYKLRNDHDIYVELDAYEKLQKENEVLREALEDVDDYKCYDYLYEEVEGE